MTKNTRTVIILLVIAVLIAVIPVAALRGAEFGGSDDAGSVMVEEIHGEYEPWFTPVLETALGGELPGELESLIFCVQTGICRSRRVRNGRARSVPWCAVSFDELAWDSRCRRRVDRTVMGTL